MIRSVLIVTGLVVTIVAIWVFFFAAPLIRPHIFPAPPPLAAEPDWPDPAPRPMTVTTTDGLTLTGYYWPAAGTGDLLVYFHGNGGDQTRTALVAGPLAAGGHGVLIASYRGYGGNPGSPSEKGLYADGDAWMALAQKLRVSGRLYIFGHSLGGGVAMEMATRHRIDGLVTFGTFTSVPDRAPFWIRPFIADRFDNAAKIARVKAPVFLFHGTADDIIPYTSADALRAESGNRATVITLRNEGHAPPLAQIAAQVWQLLSGR